MIISIGVGVLLALAGVAVKYFKWYFLIAGYNMASKKDKEKVDIEALGRFMGNMLFLAAALIIASSILHYYQYKILSMVMIFLMVAVIFYMAIKAQAYSYGTQKEKRTNKLIIIGALIPGVIIMLITLIPGAMTNEAVLEETFLRVSGMSGNTFAYESMEEIKLIEELPRANKVVGYNFGNINKGTFTVEGLGRGYLYQHSGKSPFLFIKLAGDRNFVIINYRDSEKTQQLYKGLKERVKN
ncbi:DUF3784 domain-containing protein [Alkaliphilus serpentinus]|uniref:DUF3784 domain-containing protein n=1 Tax=Alkaliphilus serpentinus TaxID=1482731 RepID=UPI0018656E46|nr:DUF3784 domain-containing protein [Alkaliphilus serpentinus]